MLAQSLFSPTELHKKNGSDMQEMCFQKGYNWNDLHFSKKRGSFIIKNTYVDGILRKLPCEIENDSVIRSKWEVVEIKNLFPIEGADNLLRTVVNGNSVVVPKTTEIGSVMLYFVSGTKLSTDYCKNNSLYDKEENNLDTTKRGFISSRQSRIKCIKLRGILSDGMLMPVNSLLYLTSDIAKMENSLGLEFTDIDGVNVCEKYVVAVRGNNNNNKVKGQKSVKISRLVENQFYLHNDTSNLRKNMDKINPNDIIGIHYKKHGTSIVIGNIKVKRQLTWLERVAKKLKIKVDDTCYDIVYSSRKVIKNSDLNPTQNDGYYGEDIWGVVAKEVGHLIPKNWTLYGEVLGYTQSGSAIQGKYDYGCKIGEHKFYVYKISVVDEDGNVIFLTDKQIEEYCEKVGLLYKDTFIYYGKAVNYFDYDSAGSDNIEEWRNQSLNHLEILYNEKSCYMCVNKVPEEGIILRVERLEQYEVYKLKSKSFLFMESEEQEKEISNIEDNQDE